MYQIKKIIYNDLDRTQKSALCNYLRAIVKQNTDSNIKDLLQKFIEDEKYYLELNASRFPFLEYMLDEEVFLKDTELYIKECMKYYKYKESQKPIIEANKAFEKQKRKFLQEVKMSKEPATKKQLYYYNKLCKRYGIEIQDTKSLSKLDLRNEIDRILNEYSGSN